MQDGKVRLDLTNNEALVFFEWLMRVDETSSGKFSHSSEQKILWLLEGQLEKQLQVFASNYRELVEYARKQVESD